MRDFFGEQLSDSGRENDPLPDDESHALGRDDPEEDDDYRSQLEIHPAESYRAPLPVGKQKARPAP